MFPTAGKKQDSQERDFREGFRVGKKLRMTQRRGRVETYLGAEIAVVATLPLHLRLEIGQLGDRHVDIAAADVRRVPEVCGHADHAPVYPEPLMRSAVVPSASVPRCPWRQAARETLHPELAVAGHVYVYSRKRFVILEIEN